MACSSVGSYSPVGTRTISVEAAGVPELITLVLGYLAAGRGNGGICGGYEGNQTPP